MKTKLMAILATTTIIAGAAQADEVIFAHGSNPGNPRFVAAETWGQLFAECSGGAHSVNVAASATMGDDAEMLTSATAGVIQVTANSQGAMSQIVPEIGLLGLPFLFEDLPTRLGRPRRGRRVLEQERQSEQTDFRTIWLIAPWRWRSPGYAGGGGGQHLASSPSSPMPPRLRYARRRCTPRTTAPMSRPRQAWIAGLEPCAKITSSA